MKSDVFNFDAKSDNEMILNSLEEFVIASGFSVDNSMTLRLLAEESLSLLNSILKVFGGKIWAENIDNKFTVHTRISGFIGSSAKKQLLEITGGKNLASDDVLGKIRSFLADMLTYDEEELTADSIKIYYPTMSFGFMGITNEAYINTWSLAEYQRKISENQKEDDWYGLEKSILINIADDILIGVKSREADLIIKKAF